MLQHKKCNAFLLGMLCILIQIIQETAGAHWNKECYNKDCHLKLLQNGKKFTWPQAYALCHKEQGYLLDDTWIKVSRFVFEWLIYEY
jgi:hypothetical protein